MSPQQLYAQAEQCIDWYWKTGHQRTGRYEVSRAACIEPLYSIRQRALAIGRSGLFPRPCMALWGPSQTGKSTLLSGCIDVDGDELGYESALTWSREEPVRFGGELKSDGSNIVVNPYNGGADGSGCISRFVAVDSVFDPAFPVEIHLAGESQILHALAAGYESECQAGKNGEEIIWGSANLRGLIDSIRDCGAPDRAGFEGLQRLTGVLDLLIMGGLRRYANLTGPWPQLRQSLLDNPKLANLQVLEEFRNALLWDSWPGLTNLSDRLIVKRNEISGLWGSDSAIIRSSWRLASLLLDIDAYKHYSRETGSRVKAFVGSVTYQHLADGSIAVGGHQGNRLFKTGEDFGLFQGLIWELRLPLRRSVLESRAPAVARFFEVADLMDFPGVSNEFEGAKKIDDQELSTNLARGLTEVLKRGKTASIAVSRAAELDIDGFSILARAGKFPGQPKQLVSGIRSWMTAYGENWPPKGRSMPLNLVITFCAKMVNDVCQGGIRNGLDSYFSLFSKLADLADPRVVTIFATTYPWLVNEGRINYPETVYAPKVQEILSDQAFLERFGENRQSFDEMVANGGTNFLFDSLTEQARSSRRPKLVADRLVEAATRLQDLMAPHLPSANAAADERNRALDKWEQGIKTLLSQQSENEYEYDPAATVGIHLRRFLNIDPEELEVLPQRAIVKHVGIETFVRKQYHGWSSSRSTLPLINKLGIGDSSHAQQILAALIESADVASVVDFFRKNLGNLTSRRDAENARRFLAVKMARAMLGEGNPAVINEELDNGAARLELLRFFADAEGNQTYRPESSPHFLQVIQPILARIHQIKGRAAGERPAQPGDDELGLLLKPRTK